MHVQQASVDRLARALSCAGSRRQALLLIGAALLGASSGNAFGLKRERDSSRSPRRKRRNDKQRGKKKKDDDTRGRNEGFPRDCKRFVISAGPDEDDKFQHIDDDLLIELIPKGRKGQTKVLLEDDNDEPNGNNGAHLKVNTFTAKVGDKIHIVARNEEAGGCELDEIWIHCTEGRGGKVKLADAITPSDCRANENKVGVFEERTVRIRNK